MIPKSKLPQLPSKWIWARLIEISETTSGGTPSRKRKEYFGGSIPWLKSGELDNNVISSSEEFITHEALRNSATKIIPRGTLLIALYGATAGKLGILGIEAAINQAICAITTYNGVSNKFLFWYLAYYRDELLGSRIGGAQPNLTQGIVKKIPVPIPPTREQQRIVFKLEELFTRLDAGVESLRNVKAQLQLYRQAILKHAFNGKLTEEWRKTSEFPPLETATKHLEEIKKERSLKLGKHKKSLSLGIFKLPQLPENWIWTRVDWLCEVQTGPFGTQLHKSDYSPSGVPTIEIGDVYPDRDLRNGTKHFIPKEKATELRKYEVKQGDVLFSRVGTVGRCTIVPKECEGWVMSTSLIRVRIISNHILPKFLLLYFWSPVAQGFAKKTSKGTTRAGTNSKIVGGLPLIIPPIKEQQKIIEEIELRFSMYDVTEEIVEKSLLHSDRLHQSILKTAFEGKLVEQDPNDEPPDMLLERIKKEKTRQSNKEKETSSTRKESRRSQRSLDGYVR